jgi:hypothetical protein
MVIDPSPIGNAFSGPVDGTPGVNPLDQTAVTMDLKRQLASLGADPASAKRKCT